MWTLTLRSSWEMKEAVTHTPWPTFPTPGPQSCCPLRQSCVSTSPRLWISTSVSCFDSALLKLIPSSCMFISTCLSHHTVMCLFLHLPSYCELPEGCTLLIIPSAWHMKALIIQNILPNKEIDEYLSLSHLKCNLSLSWPGHKTCVSCVRFFLYREALQKEKLLW